MDVPHSGCCLRRGSECVSGGGLKAPLAEGPSQGDREPMQPDQGLPRDEEMGDFQALGA